MKSLATRALNGIKAARACPALQNGSDGTDVRDQHEPQLLCFAFDGCSRGCGRTRWKQTLGRCSKNKSRRCDREYIDLDTAGQNLPEDGPPPPLTRVLVIFSFFQLGCGGRADPRV